VSQPDSRSRMVITDHNFAGEDFERAAAEQLGADFQVYDVATEADAEAAVRDADIALVNFAPMTAKVLEAMNPGAVVIRYGIGYDNVDLDAATRLGIRVCNIPDYGADTVADHTVTCVLTLLRKIQHFDRAIRRGEWPSAPELAPIRSMAETTVGLLGTGRIGQAVARRLAPFGFEVIAYDPYAEPDDLTDSPITLVELDELFRRSHVLSLHAPATPETTGIINAQNLAAMPAGALLVNTSRGALVDQDALLDALDSGHLAGAALDVFQPEPLPVDHPLRSQPNTVLTPHAAFYSEKSIRDLQRLAAEEAARAGRDEPLRCQIN
jgi:D-3-phosphoglycerate dehydrogenase